MGKKGGSVGKKRGRIVTGRKRKEDGEASRLG